MVSRICLVLLLFLPNVTFAAIPFEYDVEFDTPDARIVDSGVTGGIYAPSFVTAQDGEVFLYINTSKEQIPGPSQASCDGAVVDAADCYSLTEWINRSVDGLLTYIEFRKYVQSAIEEWIGTDAIIEDSVSLPMLGEYNLALYIEDLWNDYGCGNPLSGPILLVNPTLRIGCKFADDDTRAVDIFDEVLVPGNYSFNIGTAGAPNLNQLPNNQVAEGSVIVTVTLNRVDVDAIFRQPDFPNLVTSGYYLHTAGKMRISGVTLELEIFSVGGNLRSVPSSGYGVGIDLRRLYISGDVDLDVDSFECSFNNWCDASVLDPAHPEFNDQTAFEQKTNDTNKLVGDALRYVEASLVYEATRAAGAVTTYLTALEALDTYTLSDPRVFEHPFGGSVTWDYGFFYRFDAAADDNIGLFGGAGVDFQYSDDCNIKVPPGPRYPVMPVAEMKESTMRDGRTAMLGAGIHANVLNRALDNVWKSGLLCINLSQDTIGNIMNADAFAAFIPGLLDKYKGYPLMARLVPRYVSSTSSITEFDKSIDQPTITIGSALSVTDLTMTLPHLELEFFLDTGGGFVPLFGVEASVEVAVGLGWYKISPASTYWIDDLDNTYCDDPAEPCRVLRLSGSIDSQVNKIVSYNLPNYTADLNGAVSNLLAMVLDGYLDGWLELVINTTYVAGLVIDPALPSVTEANPLYRETVFEPLDIDNDAIYEMIGGYFVIGDVYGSMTTLGVTGMGPDGYADIVHPDLVMDMALAPGFGRAPSVAWESTELNNLVVSSWETDRFMYRIDEGLFKHSGNHISLPKLFYGKHKIEVWAVGDMGYLSDEPCVLIFSTSPASVSPSSINYGCGTASHGSLWVITLIVLFMVKYRYEK